MELNWLDFAFIALTAIFVIGLSRRKKLLSLPPGPKGLPLIGNIADIPHEQQWLTYQKWGQKFESDVLYLNLLGTSVVVLNSAKATYDLLERRSNIYSDRPSLTMLMDRSLVDCNWLFSLERYGDGWREKRRVFHQYFHPAAIVSMRPKQLRATHELLHGLLDTPVEFLEHIRHSAGALILGITYGLEVRPKNDPYVELAEAGLRAITMAGGANSFFVDLIPILKYAPAWLPGAGFKRRALEWRKSLANMAEAPFLAVKDAMADGIASPSIALSLLQKISEDEDIEEREKVYRAVAATTYAGGADTTVSILGSFFLAMLLYPETQRKAQEEIDRITGCDRLPDFDDEPELPYVTAIVKELLRWRPVVPLAPAHRLIVEDNYKGYHIPAGTLVLANSWAILHDEMTFPDASDFIPERFLNADGQLNSDMKDTELPTFGFGRRVCPGRHMATSSIWITVASVLSTFDIVKSIDRDGNIIEPSEKYTNGLLIYPEPFKCTIKPRSEVPRH